MAKKKRRVALYQNILPDRAIRGPHIFFPVFFKYYSQQEDSAFELMYFIKTNDPATLKAMYPDGSLDHPNVIFLKEHHNRFKRILETIDLLIALLRHRIDLFQALNCSNMMDPLPQLKVMQFLGFIWPIRKAFIITYNGIPTAFKNQYSGRYAGDIKYEKLFRRIHFDGIYTWYADTLPWIKESGIFRKQPIVGLISSRFCDTEKYRPEEKHKWIVWASALVPYKHPLRFVNAIAILYKKHPELLEGWKVKIYGSGQLEKEVQELIRDLRLETIVELHTASTNLAPLLNHSMCYVSTQELENFPSLAMNEAMAGGNAIIAHNYGRIGLFVNEGKNGFLTPSDDAQGVAESLEKYLSQSPEELQSMMDHSRKLCETVHTPANFITGINAFWHQVLNTSRV